MASDLHSPQSAEPVHLDAATDADRREAWFTTTADPWAELARIEHGADRTFATTVQQSVLNAEPSQQPGLETKLLAVLGTPGLTEAARQEVCRLLGWIGSEACVPALAPMLRNDRTADDARLALDRIGGPAVAEAYRQALGHLKARARLGLIGSIAALGDREAVDALARIANDPAEPSEMRAAAERAVKHLTALPRA